MAAMNDTVKMAVASLYGKSWCNAVVGNFKSLSLTFCKTVNTGPENAEIVREWKISTYYCSWRIIRNNMIILGSNDSNDLNLLNQELSKIIFKEVIFITNYTAHDVNVLFEDGTSINFINTISDNDETFHMFCPDNIYIKFNSQGAWEIGPSNRPWRQEEDIA